VKENLMRYLVLATCLLAACSSASHDDDAPPPDASGGGLAGARELAVPVPATGTVYVSLATPAIVTPAGDPTASKDWDLALSGYHVLTDSGVSGAGMGGAFGPFEPAEVDGPGAPMAPFISADEAGGAFLDWYAYDGASHVLYSRYHVFGVKTGGKLFKLQVLTYYGLDNNTPTSALYQIRYADVTAATGATQTVMIDGTAGGLAGPPTAPSGCIDLASGAVMMLAPGDAATSSAWDLCFRRDQISVNGGLGGPRGVGAVDLEASQVAGEQLAAVMAETANSEQNLFDGVTTTTFGSAMFAGDHVVSAFETGGWLDDSQSPPAPAQDQVWLVVDAGGQHQFLVTFTAFHDATAASPGTVVMQTKPVTGGSP
jgi:hypothetical protein